MQNIEIKKNQWFSDVIPVFENNTIYNKWITGIGGTTTAINEGYTVIISPNVAGIKSKEKIENVIAVYGGIDGSMIASQISQIKERGLRPVIISTPDSFWKVYDILGEQIFHDYKCIIDEIHCFQEAASYRDMLPEFLDNYFVRFERKAIITATLMPLSHPCFAKWQTVRIVPEYEYRQPLNIYYSMNQLYASVTDFITSLPEKENKIVFFNSLTLSKCLDRAGLQFSTWCAKDSKSRAVRYREFDGNLGGITLATCAYFQACDIKDKAHVIFVVDALNAPHTVLSINQILQALGRCREGVLSATLFFRPKISNSYEVMNRDELMRTIRDLVHVNLGYARIMFLDLCRQAEKPSQAQIKNILDGLRTSVFRRKMLKFNAEEYRIEVNWLNVDGEVEDRYAAQYYVGMYHLTRYLQQDERLLPHLLGQYKPSSEMIDADFLGEDQTNEEMLAKIVETYTRLNIQERKGSLEWKCMKRADTTSKTMKTMMDLCERAGEQDLIQELLETKGKRQLMQRLETKLIGKETVVKDLELRQCVKWTFKKGRYTCREIKEKLQLIYDQHGVNKRAKSTQIKEFCEVKPIVMRDKSGMSAKGFEIM